MNTKRFSYRYNFSNAALPGQGIVAAPEAYFAKQSMERVRRGTAKSPVYKLTALGRQLINGSIIYKNIKLSGTQGVTTEGKQLATQDDKVMGFDTHIMVIPSGPSTTTAPIPHPFIGKITDEISDNVKIKDKGVATKGSKAKHDDSMHMQLPGTIQFQNSPKCEGEVSGGTGSKVKVNGKEVAVIGSQVTTCNDMGMKNNSTIIAAGVSIPMPMILNPKNTEEFERDEKERENKNPKFKNVKWSVTSVEEDEEAELSACVEDICDGNMVTLQVFREGKGPENGCYLARFPLIVKDGKVSATWKYHADHDEPPPEQDPRFIFSAHSAWCNFEKSSNSLEVKLTRPEITKLEWQDADGNPVTKALVGDKLKLIAHTKDMEDGEGVTFGVYDQKGRGDRLIGATVKNGKAEIEWTYHWNGLYYNEKPRFTFEVTGQRCKKVESGECEIGATFEAVLQNQNGEILKNLDYAIIQSDDSTSNSKTDDNGIIKVEDVIPGIVEVKVSFEDIESSYIVNFSTEESNSNDEIILQPNEKTLLASKPINVNKKIIFIFYTEELDVSE